MRKKILLFAVPAAFILALSIYFWGGDFSRRNDVFEEENVIAEEIEEKQAEYLYGIPKDDYLVVKEKVGRGQNLSDILTAYGVDYVRIISLANKSKEVFDVKYMRANKPYTMFVRETDSTKQAAYFVYENSLVDYVVFDLEKDTIYKGQKEIYNKRQVATGVINSSLALTLQEINASPLLTLALSDVYAWTIDFYRLQKGDEFKVIYSENFVEGKSLGIDKIIACEFTHANEPYFAFYFEQDSIGDYFDETANSLRKAFLKAPLKFSRITSKYSLKRFHPVLKVNKPHLGTDYGAPHGTPIMSTGDGVVIAAAYTKGNGNYVKIKHNSTYTTQYLHMSKFAKGIKKGARVRQGEVIGYVGSTGLATGPHVCYRFWKNGVQVDPYKQKLPPSEPIKPEHKEAYEQLVIDLMKELEATHLQANL